MSEHRPAGVFPTTFQRRIKENGPNEALPFGVERVEPILNERKPIPPRTHFRVTSFEGDLTAGYYQLHVVPSSKTQSRHQYVLREQVDGSVSINLDYVFPSGTRLQIGLERGNEEEQIPLRVKNSSPDQYLSTQVLLKSDRSNKARHSVKFEDEDGLEVCISMEWWTLNNDEYVVIEGSLIWIDGKPRIKYECE